MCASKVSFAVNINELKYWVRYMHKKMRIEQLTRYAAVYASFVPLLMCGTFHGIRTRLGAQLPIHWITRSFCKVLNVCEFTPFCTWCTFMHLAFESCKTWNNLKAWLNLCFSFAWFCHNTRSVCTKSVRLIPQPGNFYLYRKAETSTYLLYARDTRTTNAVFLSLFNRHWKTSPQLCATTGDIV